MKSLYNQITEILKSFDDKTVDGMIKSLSVRRELLNKIERKNFTGLYSSNAYACAQIDAVGGKNWMEMLRNGDAWATNKIIKSESAKAEARNAKIAAKLMKLGEFQVVEANPIFNSTGFVGMWKVKTSEKSYIISIEVILAGGYNIQTLHNRVLVKVY